MIIRLAIVVVTLIVGWLLVNWWEHRLGIQAQGTPPGVTMFTTADCRICPPAISALEAAGVVISIRSAHEPLATRLEVRSVPTVIVVDESGMVRLRRSGRSVVTDAGVIAELANQLAAAA